MTRVRRGFLAVMFGLLALVASALSAAENADRPHGLLWHRSGLPAVFPLQIKSHAGEDYFLRLVDTETDRAVLAAYVVGGRFFRVLVPPGKYRVRFAAGRGWQGEEALFGPGTATRHFDLPEPLSFKPRDFRTKGGHLIDLRQTGPGEMAMIRRLDSCQAWRLVRGPEKVDRWRWDHPDLRDRRIPERWRFEVRPAQCGVGSG